MAKAQLKLASSKPATTKAAAPKGAKASKKPAEEAEETTDEANDEGGGDEASDDEDDGDAGDTVVVQSKVKQAVKATGMNCAGDFVPALSAHVNKLIKQAAKRAEGNGRKTVRPVDL